MEIRIDLDDGKYTYLLDEQGRQIVYRHGEPWRDITGDKFILLMAMEIDELRKKLKQFTSV